MDLTQLANLGEFIGGVAVLVTLVYLVIQVRQGSSALASNRYHDMISCVLENTFRPMSESREFAEFLHRANKSPEDLDEIDWARFVHYAYGTYAMWEDALVSYRRGVIDQDLWSAWDGVGHSLWASPAFRKFWNEERDGHTRTFQEYMDSEVFPPR